jgi:hypothetical protein
MRAVPVGVTAVTPLVIGAQTLATTATFVQERTSGERHRLHLVAQHHFRVRSGCGPVHGQHDQAGRFRDSERASRLFSFDTGTGLPTQYAVDPLSIQTCGR